MPWERRSELGAWRAFRRTSELVLTEPTRFFRTPATSDPLVPALIYGTVAYALPQILIMLLFAGVALLIGGGIAAFGSSGSEGPPLVALLGFFGVMGAVALPMNIATSIVWGAIAAVAGAGLSHGTLRLMGSRTAPFEQTLRAVCYANAAHLCGVVPGLGAMVALVWVPASETIALREVHRVSTSTALVAAIGYRLVLVLGSCLFFAAYFAVVTGVLTATGR